MKKNGRVRKLGSCKFSQCITIGELVANDWCSRESSATESYTSGLPVKTQRCFFKQVQSKCNALAFMESLNIMDGRIFFKVEVNTWSMLL